MFYKNAKFIKKILPVATREGLVVIFVLFSSYFKSDSLFQHHHFFGVGELVGGDPIEIDPTGQTRAIKSNDVRTGFHLLVNKGFHLLPKNVVDSKFNM